VSSLRRELSVDQAGGAAGACSVGGGATRQPFDGLVASASSDRGRLVMTRFRAIATCVAVASACVVPVGTASSHMTAAAPQARAAQAARAEVGAPYRWGGSSPATGFDSSGLVVWAYARAGISGLPHFSGALWTAGTRVARADLRPGDLVFFDRASHVGIYVGNGRFVHAPHTGIPVQTARLAGYGGASGYTGAVRIARSK
jgi:cell wall-associated NlpC family hydrolase